MPTVPGLIAAAVQDLLDLPAKAVHALAELGEPVEHIGVVGGDAQLAALGVADDHAAGQGVQAERSAEMGGQLHRLAVDGGEVGPVIQAVLADLKADIPQAVGTALFSAAGVPAHIVPGQGLVGGYAAVLEFADEGMDAHLLSAGTKGVPVVVPGAQKAVVGTDVAAQPGVVDPGAVDHDPLRSHGPSGDVALVFGQIELMKVHGLFLPFTLSS